MIGSKLGAYEIVARIGAGGMGEVYRAHDSRLGRDVAIKVLADGADDDHLRRFAVEARAIAALNHPNIITVFDVAEAGGVPFIATELIEGETLRDRLLAGPLPLPQALDIAIQIADGLAHAHDARIIHRDLKPQNVMIKPDGLVKIVDFGLGKMLASPPAAAETGATTLTRTGTTMPGRIIGTAGYMSPEQVTGRPLDIRSDQFAFGAVLYELITGTRAFKRDTTIETISSVLSSDPDPIAGIAPAVPPSLIRIVERCLAKRPDDRYASTRDLVHDLESAKQDLVGTRSRSRALPVQRRTFAAIGLVLAVVVLGSLGVLLLVRSQAPSPKQIAVLPFTNIQRDPANDAFADGIVELLTTNLTQLERSNDTLRVVPASDVRRYGISSASEARQTFGANLVVSGSIQRIGDTIRLTVNLIDPVTLQQRNARVIDARGDNPLALQDQTFAVVAGMLGATVQPDARATLHVGGTAVPGAYDYYVQGRGYLQRYERRENVDSAIDLFQRAVQQDERFALAHAGLGEALWRKYELTKDASLIAASRAACARAIGISDQTAAVHVTLSLVARGTGEYETAVAEATRAIALDSTSADARRELGASYAALGEFDRAEATYREAIAQRPGNWSGYNELGRFYFARRRYDDAIAQFRRVTELTPDNALGFSNLGGILLAVGQVGPAQQALEKSVALKPTAGALSNLATLYFRTGQDAAAATAFERALQIDGSDYRVWGNLGAAYHNLGSEKADAAYRKAIELAEKDLAVNRRQPRVLARLAGFHALVGDTSRAREVLQEALAGGNSDGEVLVQSAVAYEAIGDRNTAVNLLEQAIARGYPKQEVSEARGLANLREDPRIRRLLQ